MMGRRSMGKQMVGNAGPKPEMAPAAGPRRPAMIASVGPKPAMAPAAGSRGPMFAKLMAKGPMFAKLMAKGGKVGRGDGCCMKGKTKGKMR